IVSYALRGTRAYHLDLRVVMEQLRYLCCGNFACAYHETLSSPQVNEDWKEWRVTVRGMYSLKHSVAFHHLLDSMPVTFQVMTNTSQSPSVVVTLNTHYLVIHTFPDSKSSFSDSCHINTFTARLYSKPRSENDCSPI
ncbi:MAG TPA: hypothetical protein VKA94_02945, partial [Hyphomicrobiales bacterium]|nr:hypothetical protein [Hyphomicrobiales bacterium]